MKDDDCLIESIFLIIMDCILFIVGKVWNEGFWVEIMEGFVSKLVKVRI